MMMMLMMMMAVMLMLMMLMLMLITAKFGVGFWLLFFLSSFFPCQKHSFTPWYVRCHYHPHGGDGGGAAGCDAAALHADSPLHLLRIYRFLLASTTVGQVTSDSHLLK
jgi:hypothetical protein